MSSSNTGKFVVVFIIIISLASATFLIIGLQSILPSGPSNSTTTGTSTTPTTQSTSSPEPTLPTEPTTTPTFTEPVINGTEFEAIQITGDADFASKADQYGWVGTGSSSSPFIIEGLEISISTSSPYICISITDVTSHFIIRECFLQSTTNWIGTGVELWNTTNGIVDSCYISNSSMGVNMVFCKNIQVIDCAIWNSEYALNVSFSESVKIMGNQVVFAEAWNILVDNTDYVDILYNDFQYGGFGIMYWYSNHGGIIGNNVTNNDDGIQIGGPCTNVTILMNRITENNGLGIKLYESTSGCHVVNNEIGWNTGNNGEDDGTANMWDDGISMGNAWSDYGGAGDYNIPGSAGSADHYPTLLES